VSKPRRIQLSRKRGWRLPPNTVVVSRPSRWGNPFRLNGRYWSGDEGNVIVKSNADAVRLFAWMWKHRLEEMLPNSRAEFQKQLKELRGKNLACWCPLDKPCHADVLLEIANK